MANQSTRSSTAPPASDPNAPRGDLPFLAELAAARGAPVAPIAPASPIIKQEPNADNDVPAPPPHGERITIDLTEDSDDDVPAPAPGLAAPRPVTPPSAVVIESDDSLEEIPSPIAPVNRIALPEIDGPLRSSVRVWRNGARSKFVFYHINLPN